MYSWTGLTLVAMDLASLLSVNAKVTRVRAIVQTQSTRQQRGYQCVIRARQYITSAVHRPIFRLPSWHPMTTPVYPPMREAVIPQGRHPSWAGSLQPAHAARDAGPLTPVVQLDVGVAATHRETGTEVRMQDGMNRSRCACSQTGQRAAHRALSAFHGRASVAGSVPSWHAPSKSGWTLSRQTMSFTSVVLANCFANLPRTSSTR